MADNPTLSYAQGFEDFVKGRPFPSERDWAGKNQGSSRIYGLDRSEYRRGYETAAKRIDNIASREEKKEDRQLSVGYYRAGFNDALEGAELEQIDIKKFPMSQRINYQTGFLAAKDLFHAPPIEHLQNAVQNDPVKIPGHYTTGTIEVANFITDQELNYPRGNVVKYVARAGKKDPAKELEDLEKAAAYLQMAYNLAKGLPAVVRDPETKEVLWSLFQKAPVTLTNEVYENNLAAFNAFAEPGIVSPEQVRDTLVRDLPKNQDWPGANEVYEQPPPGH